MLGQVIDYAAVLADLRVKRSDIAKAIQRIERIMHAPPLPVIEVAVPPQAWTAPQQILALLERWPLQTFTRQKVAQEICSLDDKTIRVTLSRLAREGRLDRPSRGHYRARQGQFPAVRKSPGMTE